jgi:hypothetical protein
MGSLDYVAPPALVDGPVRTGARFGLFSVSTVIDETTTRWRSGVEWEPLACHDVGLLAGDCFSPYEDPPEGGWPPDPYAGVGLVESTPFAVYGSYQCSAFGRPLAEAEQRARTHLALGEETGVERAITLGLWNNLPNFTAPQDLTPAAGATLVDAFGILEDALGRNYGSAGVIHLPRSLGALASSKGLVERQGQRLETALGNGVAAGIGYSTAAGQFAGDIDIFATAPPVIRRSSVEVYPDPEFRPSSSNNDLVVIAGRVYVVAWECMDYEGNLGVVKVTVRASEEP